VPQLNDAQLLIKPQHNIYHADYYQCYTGSKRVMMMLIIVFVIDRRWYVFYQRVEIWII
jgi:hypothetical protein